jgi:hypothetical protein
MSLDLLSKSLTISPWMALTVGLGLVAITTFIVRRRIYGSLPIASLVTENDQLKKQIADLYSQNAALRSRAESARKEPVKRSAMFYGGGSPAAKLPSFDNQDPILEFRWHEGLAIEIDSRSNSGPLFISAINNTPDYMHAFMVEIVRVNKGGDVISTLDLQGQFTDLVPPRGARRWRLRHYLWTLNAPRLVNSPKVFRRDR